MIYLALAVLLVGQIILGIGLLRLTGKLREVGDNAMTALNTAAAAHDAGPFDDIPSALRPGSTVRAHDGDEQGWRLWVVVSDAHSDLIAALGERQTDFGSFRPQVMLVDQLPVDVDESRLPAVCMIDPSGIIQGAGRVSAADEVVAFIDEGVLHGLGPAPENAMTPG